MALTIDLAAGLRPPTSPERGTPDGRFVFEEKLGEGAEGLVYSAFRTQDSPSSCSGGGKRAHVAVKVVSGGRAYDRCRASRGLWPKLVHPNIVFPRESWWDDANGRCFVQMELCETDLLELVLKEGALEDERGSVFAGHLASALVHLHSQGIAHQDVKLENIFVSREGVAKLGDVGSVVEIRPNTIQLEEEDETRGSNSISGNVNNSAAAEVRVDATLIASSTSSPFFVGSVMYAPPEGISSSRRSKRSSGKAKARRDPFAADMWALGVSLWSALAGCHPWELACVDRSKEFLEFVTKGAAATIPQSFSPGLRSLLSRLLSLDPLQRPTAAEVLACPWVSAPPTTPPASSVACGSGTSIPSWPSSDELSSEHQRQQRDHCRRQQQQLHQQGRRRRQQQEEQQQQQQEPAPVTPTSEGDAARLHQDAGPPADDAAARAATSATAAAAAAAGAGGESFGSWPDEEGILWDAAQAAVVSVAASQFTAFEPSPILSRHRRSKKRKTPELEGEEEEAKTGERQTAATPSASQERGAGFVLDFRAEQEQDETFSPEMNALGCILNGGGGSGGRDSRGQRPTKIARVSPSPITLPGVMLTASELLQEDGRQDAMAAAFSGLGTQHGLLEFLKPALPPTFVMTRPSGSGGWQRRWAACPGTLRPVPTSAHAAAAASGSIWARDGVVRGSGEPKHVAAATAAADAAAAAAAADAGAGPEPGHAIFGGDKEDTSAAGTSPAVSSAAISFTVGERSE